MAKSTKKAVKNNSNQSGDAFTYLAYAVFGGAMTYGFASWAIDSGSWWHYLFTLISIYFVAHSIKTFIAKQFLNNDNKAKTRRS